MNLVYTFNDNSKKMLNYIGDEIVKAISFQYYSALKAAIHIFKQVFNISIFYVELISKDTLLLKTQDGSFKIFLEENKFKISDEKCSYTFIIHLFQRDSIIYLSELIEFQKDRIIVEHYLDNKVEIEVHFRSSGKVFEFVIPLERTFFIDLQYLSIFKETDNINSLVKFYRKIFLKHQNDYVHKYFSTIISVWQKVDNFMDYAKEGIKLDEISLKYGLINNYQLGSIKYNQDGEPVIIILKDGTYTITGYKSINSEFLDINKAILSLERRKQGLFE